MAGLEGIDASKMEIVDALGATRWVYDAEDHIAKPVFRHADFVPVAVNQDGERVMQKVRFGMPGYQGRLITNARSENLEKSRTWNVLLGKREHHCVTAVSYVVERTKDKKRTYRIQRKDGGLMVVPGLTAVRHISFSSTGNEYDDPCHVQVTAPANGFVSEVHDRFVCELTSKADIDTWMAAGDDRDALMGLLRPAAENQYEMVPIANDVWTRRGDPDAVKPQGPPVKGRQTTL